jgi:hypothetical protein
MAGLLPDRGVRCVPSYRRETTVLSTFGSPGAEVAAGDLREIADVEPSARNNRAVGTATASSFLNSDAPLAGFARRGGQRPRNGLPVQTGCCPASPRYRSGLLAESARRARCAGMRALWPHNRAICTQTTEPPINTTQVNIRRYARIAVNRPRIVSYNLFRHRRLTAKDRQATGPASASRRKRRSLGHRRCPDLSYSGPACVADCHVPDPPQGLHLGRLAPNLAPRRQNWSRCSYPDLRPRSRTRTYGILLRRHFRGEA